MVGTCAPSPSSTVTANILAETPLGEPYIWDATSRLGVCGDWCLAGRLEAAWLSGQALGIRLAHDE